MDRESLLSSLVNGEDLGSVICSFEQKSWRELHELLDLVIDNIEGLELDERAEIIREHLGDLKRFNHSPADFWAVYYTDLLPIVYV